MNKSVLSVSILILFIFPGCGNGKDIPDKGSKYEYGRSKGPSTPLTELGHKMPDTTLNGIRGLSYDVTLIPKGIKFSGKVVGGAKWEDSNGANILFITETAEKQLPGGFKEKELFAYHYISEKTELLWRINDFIKECEFDITLEYIQGSLSITDLDHNGTAESSFLYKLSCRSDVSPNGLKLIMHEGERKFALRGETKVKIGDEPPYGGTMKVDPSFDDAPGDFLEYAKSQWTKYQTENY